MGIFATNKAVASLSERLTELSMEVQSLRSAHKHLELEWEELYDKVRHQMARMSRRAKVDQPTNGELFEEIPIVEPDDGLDPISRQILARRGAPRGKL